MLTPEQIKELSHPIVARVELHRDQATNVTGNLWIEGIERFAVLIEAEVRAAARAEVEPLVRQMQSALQNLLAAVRGECPGLLDEDRGGSAYLGMDADDVIAAAGAWLSPQVGDKGDATPSSDPL